MRNQLAPPSDESHDDSIADSPAHDAAPGVAAAAPLAPVAEPAQTARDEEVAPPASTSKNGDGVARTAKCFVKLAGRVQSSGACRVSHTDALVIFDLSGKALEITHSHGRVWTAQFGGRSLGKVFKTGACWGGKGFYACEKS
jgi:hypothetical protein